jgi:hypothetical protein
MIFRTDGACAPGCALCPHPHSASCTPPSQVGVGAPPSRRTATHRLFFALRGRAGVVATPGAGITIQQSTVVSGERLGCCEAAALPRARRRVVGDLVLLPAPGTLGSRAEKATA